MMIRHMHGPVPPGASRGREDATLPNQPDSSAGVGVGVGAPDHTRAKQRAEKQPETGDFFHRLDFDT